MVVEKLCRSDLSSGSQDEDVFKGGLEANAGVPRGLSSFLLLLLLRQTH